MSVISVFLTPALNIRCMHSATVHAATIASACRPVSAASPCPQTTVCATTAMYPSTWTPRSIFTMSPSLSSRGASLDSGE